MEEIRLNLSEEEIQKLEEIKAAEGRSDLDFETFIKEYMARTMSDNIIAWDWKNGNMKRHQIIFK